MDSLLIATKRISCAEHIQKMRQVLQRLYKHGLCVKASKCTFFQEEIKLLEMWISGQGIQMDNGKVKAVVDWKALTHIKEVRSFLWLANFYRQFIPQFVALV